MKKELLEAIKDEFEMCTEAFGGPVKNHYIKKAEEELSTSLPDDCKEFIKKFGSGAIGKTIILGIGENEFVSTSFVKQTIKFRCELPTELGNIIVIGVDGAGNPIGFDSSEQLIYIYDHDTGKKQELAANFSDYVEKALNEELKIHF